MTMDMFQTRTMLDALEKMYEPKTFLLDRFFKQSEVSMTEYVDIDVYKGRRTLAPFVKPVEQGKTVQRRGYTTRSFKPPYIKVKMQTNAEDFLKRMHGDTIYQAKTPAQRATEELGRNLADLQRMIIRREEWMAAQALTTGKITVAGDAWQDEVDFLVDAGHFPNAATTWDNAAADIIDDLRTWSNLVRKDSALAPDIVILGSDVVTHFMNNAAIQKLYDNRRIEIGAVKPDELPDGSSYIGLLRVPGLIADVYSYDEWYDDGTGTLQAIMPEKKVILASSKARMARHYGAIRDLEFSGLVPARFFPKSWTEQDPSVRWILLQSAPLPVIHDVDAFVCATVL